jgi:predicted lipoprotein with Yx(FWY)xxD motif
VNLTGLGFVLAIMGTLQTMRPTTRSGGDGLVAVLLRPAGAAALAATGAIHLDLYLTGYRTIPTIGWLFLLQVIAAFALAVAVVAVRNWLADAAGAGFLLATLGGYLLSVWVGLFGFREVRTTAGIVAGIIEVAGFAVLAAAAVLAARGGGLLARLLPGPRPERSGLPAAAAVTVLAAVLLGVAVAGAGAATPAVAGGRVLKTARVHGVTVLTNAAGFTLYTFAPDKNGRSTCYGSCATYWPPVPGPVSAGSGVTGTLGTTTRTDGTRQATWNGHPLYTYVGDSAPGQNYGNNIDLNGGFWFEVKQG